MAVQPTTQIFTKVELSISCENLVKLDHLSQSDPLVVVNLQQKDLTWKRIGTTELLKNDPNPKFATPIPIQYFFEEIQRLKFYVLDIDSFDQIEATLKGNDQIGEVECTLGEIVGGRGSSKTFVIKNALHTSRVNGSLTVKAAEIADNATVVSFKLSASNLDKKDFLGKSDPYLIIHRGDVNGSFTPIHKTEMIKQNLNPVWKEFTIPSGRLCSDPNQPIKIECFDWDKDGGDDLIGEFTTTLNELKAKKSFELIEPKIRAKKGKKYINSGNVVVNEIREYKVPTFLDFVTSGTEISLIVGVDYTASNGDPRQPSSLHYFDPHGPNAYMQAIRIVGDVVAPYDYDGMIPAYGFGAKINGAVNHCFHLNAQPDPSVRGVDGLLYAYQNSFQWAQLYGPTNFAPIIRQVASVSDAGVPPGRKYTILLMITDGEITDLDDTIEAIRQASARALSIIIVGVGNADFQSMSRLDDDEGKLFSRDIVQFVALRDYQNRPLSDLAKDTLVEVPPQLLQYMKVNNILPLSQQQPRI
eukprot:TRINITY_DN556_c0_g1_i2.p1 TRINITY_DN556_c0_g1~~TRINITY_DN556_c0_g1_i2.p1  ORF type:complete len:528 (+),score=164.45 TRINITY_DN556_c0_g1_i2:60-1643(+)